MVRPANENLLSELASKPLAGLARSLDIDIDSWITSATSPLPITMRITSKRHDVEWTREQLSIMGGERIAWLTTQEAWVLPFSKESWPNEKFRKMVMLLHETGRVTRQEAVSMLPPVILEPKSDDLVMDTCAAPGSKATQLAEMIENGLLLANEPSAGRLNLLVTNRDRLGLSNMLIMQHDGRHVGRMPEPGLDGIIVDAPCTGSATTRKNRDLWWKWTPKAGRSLFKLQIGIAFRAAQLLKPGGKLVYSTCSLDPTENEAVVCEILRKCPWLELVKIDSEKLLPGMKIHHGISNWQILDETGNPVEWNGEMPNLPGLSEEMLNPTQKNEPIPKLDYTIRVHQQDNDTGGFFVALFEHVKERTPEGVSRSMILKRPLERESVELARQKPNRHTTVLADDQIVSNICNEWGIDSSNFSWWKRGKRINLCSTAVLEKIYQPIVINNKGDYWPSNTFHPLKMIHVGQPSFTDNKNMWRPRQKSLELLRTHITKRIIDVSLSVLIELLNGNVPLVEEFDYELPEGSAILRCEEHLVPIWIAARVSLMLDDNECEIIKIKLGIDNEVDEV
ncbi:MAG: RsmB/NOP family class I SAM-dependent RNA methyltransferase [Candidatus Poseidoniaceae archaeon]|jgi:16S rRNA C967 or C1407 C5-methylase (RsmB/RsmF family)|nr:RsmB/NOP family class I SAM-dependent RNA methyltransferase [Candidatus Poseidoniaceae archaeon]